MKLIKQLDQMDCGPTCLKMIASHYGQDVSLEQLRELCEKGQQGVSLFGINAAAEKLGFDASPMRLQPEFFFSDATLPCIVHWSGNHYVVVYKIKRNKVYIADPEVGKTTLSYKEFEQFWIQGDGYGIALMLSPTEDFYQFDEPEHQCNRGISRLVQYVWRFKRLLGQLGLGALIGMLLNFAMPFLTQSLVDYGIGNSDINFLYAILIAQILLFISKTSVDFLRSWILIHVGARINVAIISDFLMKLMRLPISYFNSRNLGDVLQRVSDHTKIEEFLTSHSLNIIFSTLNIFMFSIVLLSYSYEIFFTFLLGTLLAVVWVSLFLSRRRVLDYKKFAQLSENQNAIVQLVKGMPEIRLNHDERRQQRKWIKIQSNLFKVRLSALALEQQQQAGALFFNEGKNITITFIAALQVTSGEMSLGMMLAISYIIGQLNAPIEQLIIFIKQAQDAKISMERLSEIQSMKDEKDLSYNISFNEKMSSDIFIQNLSFKYSKYDENILSKVTFTIPQNKTTAIVGSSGSGKTTLMKIMLKFFYLNEGQISVNGYNLNNICPDYWRSQCGVVMQDGFIFSDSVANNIALGTKKIDFEKLFSAAKLANLHNEIEKLPQGYFTKIGAEGLGLSGGQKQRVLIARAIYKNPEIVFLDEATSALDAKNELVIQRNLKRAFHAKTVVVVAHRLSTVKHADNIIVLDKGNIVEQGNHDELVKNRGFYFELIKNQLELGN